MSSCGLLILSNVKKVQNSLEIIRKHVQNVYIHLNIQKYPHPPAWSAIITKIYQDSINSNDDLDVRVLITPLKTKILDKNLNKRIDYLFSDQKIPTEICEELRMKFSIQKPTIYLADNCIQDMEIENLSPSSPSLSEIEDQMVDSVVLGGTFDRIHIGHKILLSEAILRACRRLVVGVTDENMITSKILHELILPVDQRIKDVKEFLTDIDSTLQYDVVAIQDAFGPTKSDPDMDMIIVSSETYRGGEKVNEVRTANGLKPLKIYCIPMINDEDASKFQYKDNKVSSSNKRMDLLGTRINPKEPRPNLPNRPYIIGLAGGIASGKTKMGERLQSFGAFVIDCDKLAHELYEPGKECYKRILDFFGNEIIGDDERIDRKKLGGIVFGNPEKLQKLNEIVWPELLIEAKKRIHDAYQKKPFDVAVIEAAVLLKARWETECHEVWTMIISPKEAIKRLKERNNLNEDEAIKRLASQLDNKEFVRRSNVIFSSEWTHEFTQKQAEKAWKMLMSELHKI